VKIINWIKRVFPFYKFISFILIGVVNTVNAVLLSWLYSSFLHANMAFVAGYITSNIISYILNSIFTFKEKLSFNCYIRFFISYIPNFLIQNAVVFLVHNMWKKPELAAYAAAAILSVPITFLLLSMFTFGRRKSE